MLSGPNHVLNILVAFVLHKVIVLLLSLHGPLLGVDGSAFQVTVLIEGHLERVFPDRKVDRRKESETSHSVEFGVALDDLILVPRDRLTIVLFQELLVF